MYHCKQQRNAASEIFGYYCQKHTNKHLNSINTDAVYRKRRCQVYTRVSF